MRLDLFVKSKYQSSTIILYIKYSVRDLLCNVKTGCLKMRDMKLLDMKLTDQVTGHENAGHENTGHEFARRDK